MMNLGSEMFEGDHRDKCSVDDFITHMPAGSGSGSGSSICQELFGLKDGRLRVFGYFGYPGTSKFSASAGSMVDKIIRFLQSLSTLSGGSSVLLQLWTPIRCSSGGVVLTVSEQPFAIMKLCKGLCRYRYSCIQQDIDVEGALVGPIGKVFSQGYPTDYDSTSSSLSNCDFAKPYGIGKDWKCMAFPLYECDNADNGLLQQCAGVLELFSYCPIYSRFVGGLLKSRNIKTTRLDILQCFRARCSVIKSAIDWNTLHCLKKELKSLLIQIWLPCMCHTTSGSTNEFLCTQTSMDLSFEGDDYLFRPHSSCTGKIPNPWVRRAYSENKTCFIRETSQLSISDYPPVHFTLSNRLKDCFVVPLKSIHPEFPPLVLGVFPPRLQNCDLGNFSAQLNSLLSTVARVLSKRNAAFGLQENEEFFIRKCHSDNDNVIFFEIHRMARVAAIGQGTEDSGQDGGIPDAFVNRVTIREEDKIAASDSISIPAIEKGKSITPGNHKIDRGCNMFRDESFFDNFLADHFSAGSASIGIDFPAGSVAFSRISGSVSFQTISKDDCISISHSKFTQTISNNGEVEITSEMVKSNQVQPPGGDEIDKCRSLTVSVKRSFRVFGVELNTDFPPSSARLKKNKSVEIGQCSNESTVAISSIPLGFSITVEARYKNDTIKFVWGTASSGIEGLCRKLAEKFGLEVGRFNIAYEDEDGDRVHFFSDEDLRFCLDTLKASKQSTLKLEIVTGFFSDQDVRIFNHLEYASTAMENGETDQGNNIIEVQDEVAAITQGDIPIEVEDEVAAGQHFIMSVKATYMGNTEMFPRSMANSGIEELSRELGKRFRLEVGRFDIKYMDEDGDWITLSYDEDLRLCLDTLKASKQSTLKLELSTGKVDITLEKINQYRGRTTQEDAAEKLNVSLSTLQLRCMELGLGGWPYSKRKNGDCHPSSPRELKKTKGQCSIADAIENEDAATKSVPLGEIARDKSTAAGNDEFDRKNDIIAVLATYKDVTVPFPFYCNSGIEELRKELYDLFQIKGETYKVKYENEDGRWITLLRDKHLRFRIETLKASGPSTMELSAFPNEYS